MQTFLAICLGFIVGALVGAYFMYGFLQVAFSERLKKLLSEKLNNLQNNSKDAVHKLDHLKSKVETLSDLVQRQQDLLGSLDQPSKNATHSKHKNQVISQIKDLEAQKIVILKEILAEGVDLDIKVLTPDGEKIMKLSEAIKVHEKNLGATSYAPPTDPQPSKSNILKLIKNKKDEEDDEPKSSGPTLH